MSPAPRERPREDGAGAPGVLRVQPGQTRRGLFRLEDPLAFVREATTWRGDRAQVGWLCRARRQLPAESLVCAGRPPIPRGLCLVLSVPDPHPGARLGPCRLGFSSLRHSSDALTTPRGSGGCP